MDKKFRVMVGENGDDFIFASDLSYEEAIEKEQTLSLKNGAYSYIEEDN